MLVSWATEKLRLQKTYPAPVVAEPLCIIGDIHGRFDLLRRLIDKLPAGHRIICVGDYIDRGEHSADVLQFLMQHPDILCLQGNHEEMLLHFLSNPVQNGRSWLDNGGLQTLASYKVPGVTAYMRTAEVTAARDRLLSHMGQDMVNWLSNLSTSHLSGNVLVTHAGADPRQPVDAQSDRVLQWGHPDFFRQTRRDGHWVVHGHTIVTAPAARNGRISIDTGAYATGRLTAVCLTGDETPRFLSVP